MVYEAYSANYIIVLKSGQCTLCVFEPFKIDLSRRLYHRETDARFSVFDNILPSMT